MQVAGASTKFASTMYARTAESNSSHYAAQTKNISAFKSLPTENLPSQVKNEDAAIIKFSEAAKEYLSISSR